jgi:hypothetical protein
MSNTIISPNMNLPVPVPTVDPGPDYANNEVQCFNQIDSHNHTPGNGVPITPAGLNINSALNIQQQALQNVGQINFTSQTSLTTPSTLYEEGADLYYNDGVGNIVRITQSGSVTGAAGTITGLPSGTASASFQSVSGTFQFQSATNTPANITGASLTLAPQTTGTNNITISTPNPLPSTYSITLPSSTPAATNILTMGTDGTIYNALNVDNSTLTIAANVLKVPNGGITSTQIANATITQSNLANGSVGGSQIADNAVTEINMGAANKAFGSGNSGPFLVTPLNTWNNVPNCSCTLQTQWGAGSVTRPVLITITSDPATSSDYAGFQINNGPGGANLGLLIRLLANGSYVAQWQVAYNPGNATGLWVFPASLSFVHIPGSLNTTYQLQAYTSYSGSYPTLVSGYVNYVGITAVQF